jgi:hypothetical protein
MADLGEVDWVLGMLGHPPLAEGDVNVVSRPTPDEGRVSAGSTELAPVLEPEFARDVPKLLG